MSQFYWAAQNTEAALVTVTQPRQGSKKHVLWLQDYGLNYTYIVIRIRNHGGFSQICDSFYCNFVHYVSEMHHDPSSV